MGKDSLEGRVDGHQGRCRVEVVVVGVAAARKLPLDGCAHVARREVHQRQRKQRPGRMLQPRSLRTA